LVLVPFTLLLVDGFLELLEVADLVSFALTLDMQVKHGRLHDGVEERLKGVAYPTPN
jgi:hypothetical protein